MKNQIKCKLCDMEFTNFVAESHLSVQHNMSTLEYINVYPDDPEKEKLAKFKYVTCEICRERLIRMTLVHLGYHGFKSFVEYREKYPHAKIISDKDKERNSGENNYGWNGGTTFDPYPITFTETFKMMIKERDNFTCQKCGKGELEYGEILCVHHIDYNRQNTVKKNCITLCRGDNGRVNINRKYWINHFRVMMKEKHGYNYEKETTILENI